MQTTYTFNYSSYIQLAILIASILAKYMINKKAGVTGWYALIPFYSTYLLYKYADRPGSYFIVLIASTIGTILFAIGSFILIFSAFYDLSSSEDFMIEFEEETEIVELTPVFASHQSLGLILMGIALIILIIALVFKYKQCKGLAYNFGAGNGFAIILLIFQFIGLLIIALDSEYQYKVNQYYDDDQDGILDYNGGYDQ